MKNKKIFCFIFTKNEYQMEKCQKPLNIKS